MTNNADAQIAREWASKALDNDLLDEVPIAGYRAAARHILATTSPTMADVTHDKLREQAINLRALHQSLDGLSVDRIDGVYFRALVSAIGAHADMLEAFLPTPPTMADIAWDDEVHAGLCAEHCDGDVVLMLGKEPEDDDLIYCRWISNGEMVFNPLDRLNLTPIPGTKIDLTPRREPEPESTPGHPEFLETEEDYENAPVGTIVAQDDGKPFVLIDEGWRVANGWAIGHGDMSGTRRRVLRWGWEA